MIDEGFDEVIHNPVRLRLCVLLAPARMIHFAVLRDELAVADSVLSKHLKTLTDAGYVALEKINRPAARPITAASLTQQGRQALAGHLAALHRLMEQAESDNEPPRNEG